jgi:hypothetical protein
MIQVVTCPYCEAQFYPLSVYISIVPVPTAALIGLAPDTGTPLPLGYQAVSGGSLTLQSEGKKEL